MDLVAEAGAVDWDFATWCCYVSRYDAREPDARDMFECLLAYQARGPHRLELTGVGSRAGAEGLAPRSHHKALAFFIRQPEPLHSGSLGRLLVWCLDNPDVLRALSAWD